MNNSIVQIPRPLVKGTEGGNWDQDRRRWSLPPEADVKMECQASVPRDAFPPTPPGPEGSNGNGLLRVQWVAGAWLKRSSDSNLPIPPASSARKLDRLGDGRIILNNALHAAIVTLEVL